MHACLLCTTSSLFFCVQQINRGDYQLDPVHLHHRTEKDWFQARGGCTHADGFSGKLDLLAQLEGRIDTDLHHCTQSFVVVVEFPSWALWGPFSICRCTLTNSFHRVRGLCMWPFFVTICLFLGPRHIGSHMPSWEELSPYLESWCCCVMRLSWLKIVPI